MAFSKVKAGGLADNSVGSSQISPDTVVASDIAANAVTASELADNAVDTDAIAANAVVTAKIADSTGASDGITTAKLATNAVTTAKITDANITAAKLNTDVTDGSAITTEVKPHIIPGTLYPAYDNKKLDGTALAASTTGPAGSTVTSSKYGTVQSDGKMYYYTSIRGSKPIKDPRIGAYFGSQRHKFKSVQLLEQETGVHGKNVYSVDGREYIRASGDGDITLNYSSDSSNGQVTLPGGKNAYIEIVGYFSDANVISYNNANRDVRYTLDDASEDTTDYGSSNQGSPLSGRYVDSGGLVNFGLGATLGIHTIKITSKEASENVYVHGIELIAQDTSSAANRLKIQIPAQNVVSFGKKFPISATATHYNPFATKGDGSASTIPDNNTGDSVNTGWEGSTSNHWDSSLDTATSLGLSAWESSGNYYRPVNGGRVVKWVDSSGVIKTSVNMMPPEAHAIDSQTIASGVATGNNLPTGTHNWSSQYQPQFGNKTVGSNLLTAMADNSSYPFETRPSGGLNGAWNNTSGYGLAYVAVTLTQGKLYRIRFDASSVSGVASYIGTASNSAATNWKNKVLITAGTNLTGVFRADSQTAMIVMHTANGAAAFTLSNMTLYEVEEPNLQAEVAKTFHWREFGNGAANQGSNTSGTLQDASMLYAADHIAYVMDDGLTSLAGDDVNGNSAARPLQAESNSDFFYITFIGTGITMDCQQDTVGIFNFAQNLPYGTHVLKVLKDSTHKVHLDGVEIKSGTLYSPMEITFHQPKRPPIPEDAVVLADYMLMADFVSANTSHDNGRICKGVRRNNCTRDHFYDSSASFASNVTLNLTYGQEFGFWARQTGSATSTVKLPFFGTRFICILDGQHQSNTLTIDGGSDTYNSGTIKLDNATTTNLDGVISPAQTLGNHNFTLTQPSGAYTYAGTDIVTPIHTSHHYQSFETPYLHELVGGDRNMEQTNLICTPDGKTWDEITRNTSYIGNGRFLASRDGGDFTGAGQAYIYDYFRGNLNHVGAPHVAVQKNFAIAYDRIICLVEGHYKVTTQNFSADADRQIQVMKNSVIDANDRTIAFGRTDTADFTIALTGNTFLKRGDFIGVRFDGATFRGALKHFTFISIEKI